VYLADLLGGAFDSVLLFELSRSCRPHLVSIANGISNERGRLRGCCQRHR
jgi:hypothetical protein